jgi:hypothetical protein
MIYPVTASTFMQNITVIQEKPFAIIHSDVPVIGQELLDQLLVLYLYIVLSVVAYVKVKA